jgi:hypothetical protein
MDALRDWVFKMIEHMERDVQRDARSCLRITTSSKTGLLGRRHVVPRLQTEEKASYKMRAWSMVDLYIYRIKSVTLLQVSFGAKEGAGQALVILVSGCLLEPTEPYS